MNPVTKLSVSLMLFGSLAVAQAAPAGQKTAPAKPAAPAASKPASSQPAPAASKPAPAQQTAAPDASASIPDSASIITLNGFCDPGATAPCKKNITKGEFAKAANAVNPNLAADARRNFAALYIQLLVLANEAQKEGLDKDPSFPERVRLETLRLMAASKESKLAEGTRPTDAEIQNFYNENADLFQQLAIRRIIIPKSVEKNSVSAEELKKLAESTQTRAAAGEDTDKLQAEVWVKAVLPGTPPSTNFGWRSRGQLPQDMAQSILALKSGQTSNLMEDTQVYYVFKIDGKRLVQLKDATEEITQFIANQRYQAKLNQLLSGLKADLDEKFFGPPPAAPEAAPSTPKK